MGGAGLGADRPRGPLDTFMKVHLIGWFVRKLCQKPARGVPVINPFGVCQQSQRLDYEQLGEAAAPSRLFPVCPRDSVTSSFLFRVLCIAMFL